MNPKNPYFNLKNPFIGVASADPSACRDTPIWSSGPLACVLDGLGRPVFDTKNLDSLLIKFETIARMGPDAAWMADYIRYLKWEHEHENPEATL